jgi:hypothetical protein
MSDLKKSATVPFVPPPLRRTLSVTYNGPNGPTAYDPASYQGAERKAHEDALVKTHPNTSYADGIKKKRNNSNKKTCRQDETGFFSKKNDSDKDDSAPLAIPTCGS